MTDVQQLEHAQRGLIAMWQLWMQWFIWFYGAQVVLIWTRPAVFDRFLELIAWLWIAFSVSGGVVAILVAHYTWTVGRDLPGIGFPTRYASIGALLNALALFAGCLI